MNKVETVKTISRREMFRTSVRTGMLVIISGVTLLLGEKLVLKRDCRSCSLSGTCVSFEECVVDYNER